MVLLKTKKLAVKFYELAALQNYPRAQCNLGYMYNNGFGVQKDKQMALKYYQLSAEQGYYVAQYNLGFMYEGSKGIENKRLAVKYYTLAAQQGYENAKKRSMEICKGEVNSEYRRIAAEFFSSEWPKFHSMLNRQCQKALLEVFWCLKNLPGISIPVELIFLVAQQLIQVWPQPHFENNVP